MYSGLRNRVVDPAFARWHGQACQPETDSFTAHPDHLRLGHADFDDAFRGDEAQQGWRRIFGHRDGGAAVQNFDSKENAMGHAAMHCAEVEPFFHAGLCRQMRKCHIGTIATKGNTSKIERHNTLPYQPRDCAGSF